MGQGEGISFWRQQRRGIIPGILPSVGNAISRAALKRVPVCFRQRGRTKLTPREGLPAPSMVLALRAALKRVQIRSRRICRT